MTATLPPLPMFELTDKPALYTADQLRAYGAACAAAAALVEREACAVIAETHGTRHTTDGPDIAAAIRARKDTE